MALSSRQLQQQKQQQQQKTVLRGMSNETKKNDNSSSSDSNKEEGKEEGKEIVLTPGEQVVMASQLAMWGFLALLAAACAYYIIVELLPTKMSPNTVFNKSFSVVKADPEVVRLYGEPLKAYGRDGGGKREGRRNFIEHTEYKNEEDDSKRTRVRYNLEGPAGQAFVFAEVSSKQPSGEFVYVMVQNKLNGRVHTIIDNRAAMTAARLSAGNKEAQSAMEQLLGGGRN